MNPYALVASSVHVWQRCHGCGAQPIYGTRYDCDTCPAGPDRHLCSHCHALYERKALTHPVDARTEGDVLPHTFTAKADSNLDVAAAWRRIGDITATAPSVAERFVVRPEFQVGRNSALGSYGFVLRLTPTHPILLVTALHVLDEAAKWLQIDCSIQNTAFSGRELPAAISRVRMYDVFAPQWMFAELGAAAPMLMLPNARTGEEEPRCQRDIAAFEIREHGHIFSQVEAARSAPAAREPVWLAAPVDLSRGLRTAAATVVELTETSFIYRFAEGSRRVRHSSGAPLLDRQGAVVGINIGEGYFDGRHYGHGVHAANMWRHFASAMPNLNDGPARMGSR
jgi:hypothetical protein